MFALMKVEHHAHSYEAAQALFTKIKPVRNRDESMRPLGTRRSDDTKRVVEMDNHYHFIYHATTLVVWQAPTRFLVKRHDSMSSRTFIHAFLPFGVTVCSKNGYTALVNHEGTWILADNKEWLAFNFIDGRWHLENPQDTFTHYRYEVIDHKKARALSLLAQDYSNWCRIAHKDNKVVRMSLEDINTPYELRTLPLLQDPPDFGRTYAAMRNNRNMLQHLNVASKNIRKVAAPPGVIPGASIYARYDHSGLIDESLS